MTREKVDVMAELDKAKMQIMQYELHITKVRQNAENINNGGIKHEMSVVQTEKLMYEIWWRDNCFYDWTVGY